MPSAPNSIAAPRPPPPSRPNGNNPGSNPVSQNQNNSRSFQYVPKKRPVLQDDSDESDETDSDWKNSYSVSNSYIQKKTTKRTNRESFQQKKKQKNIKLKKNKQRNPKIRSFNYAKRWLYLQKKQKRFSNQTNQKKKKGQFLFAICVKNHW